jgi:putative zinc finger/helix-turn-helix YgiT family protein
MSARCEKCGGELTKKMVEHYEDSLMGIPVVLYRSVMQSACEACQDIETTIPNMNGLISATAVARIKIAIKLKGTEIRFLRKALGVSGKKLAELLGVRDETVSRWENGKEPIGPTSEKLLRLLVGLELSSQAPGIDFDEREIGQMSIKAVQSSDKPVVLFLECVAMRVDRKKREEVWEENEKQLATATG